MTSDTLSFDMRGAAYLNWGVGSAGARVLGRGLAEGVWTCGAEQIFSAKGASVSQASLPGAMSEDLLECKVYCST